MIPLIDLTLITDAKAGNRYDRLAMPQSGI
jgi:hypothetical protein